MLQFMAHSLEGGVQCQVTLGEGNHQCMHALERLPFQNPLNKSPLSKSPLSMSPTHRGLLAVLHELCKIEQSV